MKREEILRIELVKEYSEFFKTRSYMEFGVHTGTSILHFYNLYRNIDGCVSKFYGFDSFKGLPVESKDVNNPTYWTVGHPHLLNLTLNGRIPDVLKGNDNMFIIDGWFNETLTPEFSKSLDQKIGLLHIDCDIYTSAYDALDFCFKNNLMESGSVIMYDDWGGYLEKLGPGHEFEAGEGLAHKEIMEKYGIECDFKDKRIICDGYEIAVFVVK
jgi:hypothetical protein